MTVPAVRSSVLPIGEVYVNVNDLIIVLMKREENAKSQEERQAIAHIVEFLIAKRDKANVK